MAGKKDNSAGKSVFLKPPVHVDSTGFAEAQIDVENAVRALQYFFLFFDRLLETERTDAFYAHGELYELAKDGHQIGLIIE